MTAPRQAQSANPTGWSAALGLAVLVGLLVAGWAILVMLLIYLIITT